MSKKRKKAEEKEIQVDDTVLEKKPVPEEDKVPEVEPGVDEIIEEEPAQEEEPELSLEEILQLERDEFKGKWLRVVAELDNVRKRSRRELVDGRRFAQAEVLRSFLEVQDNFERALQSMASDDDTGSDQSLREGVELIFQSFRRVLKDQKVQAIEALEQDFDPAVHEAVGQFEREGVEPGKVIEVVQQGFRMGDMVLRPSRVIISS